MFLMAFGVQEMAVGQIQVTKQYQDNFSRVLIFTIWDSFTNIAKIGTNILPDLFFTKR